MQMSEYEIREKFKRHGGKTENSQREYISILAQLNCTKPKVIRQIIDGTCVNGAGGVVDKRKEDKAIKYTSEEEKPLVAFLTTIDGIEEVLLREAAVSYICSMREDNERLRGLITRQMRTGGGLYGIPQKVEVNEQKIDVLRRWLGYG